MVDPPVFLKWITPLGGAWLGVASPVPAFCGAASCRTTKATFCREARQKECFAEAAKLPIRVGPGVVPPSGFTGGKAAY